MNLILIANWTPVLYSVVNYVHYILAYLPAVSVVIRSYALFERICGRPYCLQGGHSSLKITLTRLNLTLADHKDANLIRKNGSEKCHIKHFTLECMVFLCIYRRGIFVVTNRYDVKFASRLV